MPSEVPPSAPLSATLMTSECFLLNLARQVTITLEILRQAVLADEKVLLFSQVRLPPDYHLITI